MTWNFGGSICLLRKSIKSPPAWLRLIIERPTPRPPDDLPVLLPRSWGIPHRRNLPALDAPHFSSEDLVLPSVVPGITCRLLDTRRMPGRSSCADSESVLLQNAQLMRHTVRCEKSRSSEFLCCTVTAYDGFFVKLCA